MKPTALLLTLTLAACAGQSDTTEALVASPAAANCTAHQGRILIRQTSAGSKGYCKLPGGKVLGLWEYLNQMNP